MVNVERIRELHSWRPSARVVNGELVDWFVCNECSGAKKFGKIDIAYEVDFPCPTLQALDA